MGKKIGGTHPREFSNTLEATDRIESGMNSSDRRAGASQSTNAPVLQAGFLHLTHFELRRKGARPTVLAGCPRDRLLELEGRDGTGGGIR